MAAAAAAKQVKEKTLESYLGIRSPQWKDNPIINNLLPTIDSDELIGIEVEVENARRVAGRDWEIYWEAKQDGSLRNNGVEYVTKPMSAREAPQALDILLNRCLSKECSFSPRTSVHVHLNILNMTADQLRNMNLLYVLLEKFFYAFAGRGRAKNIYCVPVCDSNLLDGILTSGVTNNNWSKYSGYNLLPIRTQGTVEYRHMHGTRDVQKLSQWIGMIVSLKRYAMQANTKELRARLCAIVSDSEVMQIANEVFGQYVSIPTSNFNNVMQVKLAMTDGRYKILKDSSFFNFKGI